MNKANINFNINSQKTKVIEKKSTKSQRKIDEFNNLNINNNNVNQNQNIILTKMLKHNNSSLNQLFESDSKFFRNNLNNASINSFSNLVYSKKNNKSNNKITDNSNNNNNNKNELDKNDDGSYQEAILNKSNKSTILIFKRYYIIMILISIVIIIFSVYKIRNDYLYNKYSNRFINDFKIIATRYLDLYYYFITLKSLFILGENDYRWKYSLNVMENIMNRFDKSNIEYSNILLSGKISDYNEVAKLFEIFQYNKNDSIQYINEYVCGNITTCQNYLKSEDNIFVSGIENGFRTCITYMNNIVKDYKSIKNKTNITQIISVITCSECYEFRKARKAFTNLYFYLQQMIYSGFEKDNHNFRTKNNYTINSLNIYSIVFSILIFLFVFLVIFITVDNFIKPIQDSSSRVNNSFFNIEKY